MADPGEDLTNMLLNARLAFFTCLAAQVVMLGVAAQARDRWKDTTYEQHFLCTVHSRDSTTTYAFRGPAGAQAVDKSLPTFLNQTVTAVGSNGIDDSVRAATRRATRSRTGPSLSSVLWPNYRLPEEQAIRRKVVAYRWLTDLLGVQQPSLEEVQPLVDEVHAALCHNIYLPANADNLTKEQWQEELGEHSAAAHPPPRTAHNLTLALHCRKTARTPPTAAGQESSKAPRPAAAGTQQQAACS
jgi:hypothetical protein